MSTPCACTRTANLVTAAITLAPAVLCIPLGLYLGGHPHITSHTITQFVMEELLGPWCFFSLFAPVFILLRGTYKSVLPLRLLLCECCSVVRLCSPLMRGMACVW